MHSAMIFAIFIHILACLIVDGFSYCRLPQYFKSSSVIQSSAKVPLLPWHHLSVKRHATENCNKDIPTTALINYVEYHGWNQSKSLSIDIETLSFQDSKRNAFTVWWKSAIFSTFLPSGDINSQYFRYVRWRTLQRMISSTNNVFGTQALLMALGFKRSKIGVAAATSWVLKDALGKLARVAWASGFGRRFDSNAKKWRFKAAVLYALGNCLEVSTLIFPSYFLVAAALGNALKQVAMLTASSTRNSIYKSFSGQSDNIGDITAKGEAQIAVLDTLGMLVGVWISRVVDSSKWKVIGIFSTLTMIDVLCVFKEIQSVVFKSLNFDRSCMVIPSIIRNAEAAATDTRLSPLAVARREGLCLVPKVDESLVKVWSTLSKTGLQQFLQLSTNTQSENSNREDKFVVLFSLRPVKTAKEKFLLQSGLLPNAWLGSIQGVSVMFSSEVLLQQHASAYDLFRALIITWKGGMEFESYCERNGSSVKNKNNDTGSVVFDKITAGEIDSKDTLSEIALQLRTVASAYERDNSKRILQALTSLGWDTKSFSLGSLRMRVKF